jgi:hypothetical protein
MTSYKTNDPKGWGGDPKRGAALGRPTIQGELDEGETISIFRKQLDGDYDENDTYFGGGPDVDPLFWVSSESGGVDYMIRAKGISDALQGITFTVRIVERIVGDVIDKERIYSIVFDREQLLDSVIGFIYAVIRLAIHLRQGQERIELAFLVVILPQLTSTGYFWMILSRSCF